MAEDESVGKLRFFNEKVLQEAIEKVTKANPELNSHAEILGELDDEVVGTGNLLGEALDSLQSDFAADLEMAVDAIKAVEQTAQDAAGDQLPDLGTQLDNGGAAFVKQAEEAQRALSAAAAELNTSGFQDATKDLAAAESSLDDAAVVVASAFENVEKGAPSLAAQVAAALKEAAGKAGGAAGELDGYKQTMASEGQAAVGVVSAACTQAAGIYEGMTGDFEGFYEEIKGKVVAEGDTFMECVQKLLEAQKEEAQAKEVERLSAPMDITIENLLHPHLDELGHWVETVERAALSTANLRELAVDLKKAKRVAEEIERAAEGIGG